MIQDLKFFIEQEWRKYDIIWNLTIFSENETNPMITIFSYKEKSQIDTLVEGLKTLVENSCINTLTEE